MLPFRRCVPLCAVLLLPVTTQALAEFGRTQGAFNVSGGAATYSIPIWTPPGPNGLTPNIALMYSSAGGNGAGGVGWNISAVSSIERCNRTEPQDGNAAPVKLDLTDRFCIGGNRLRVQTGTYGANGSSYFTEIADYSRITAYGIAGNGPEYFVVEAKSGLKYEYGGVSSSRVLLGTTALRWMLSKVYDRNGNNYVITYDNANGFAVPNTIHWTPTYLSSGTYRYEAKFNYSTSRSDEDSIIGRVAGYDVSNRNRLESIQIKSNGSVIRKYRFNYDLSPSTSRSRLVSAKECADDAENNCLLPLTFGYQAGLTGISSIPVGGLSASSSLANGKYDFNGDGRSDLLYVSAGSWHVSLSTGTGFGAGVNTGISSSATFHVQRFLASQQDGLLVNVSNSWSYVSYNGSGAFVSQATSVPAVSSSVVTDNNGDGMADLVWTSGGNVMLRLNNSSAGATFPTFATAITAASFSVGQGNVSIINAQNCPFNRMCDLNGDRRADLMVNVVTVTCSGMSCSTSDAKYDLYAHGNGYGAGALVGAISYRGMQFNDDRCIDRVPSNATSTLQVSSCGGPFTTVNLPVAGGIYMDWNGDGRTDIVANTGGFFGVYLSKGNSASPFSSLVMTTIPYSTSCQYFVFDPDGDGLDDLGCVGTSLPFALTVYLRNGSGSVYLTHEPDLLNSIVDGFGVTIAPFYVATSQNNYVRGTGTQIPLYDATDPITVVAQVASSDGNGGSYTKTYTYHGARMNLPRAESAGFQRIDEVDSRNGIITRTYFDQLFPRAGMVNQQEVMQPNGATTISRVVYTNSFATLDATSQNQRYFAYVQNSTATQYEVGGSYDGNLLRTIATSNVFDNASGSLYDQTTVTTEPASLANGVTAGGSWTSRTHSPLSDMVNNTSTWCLGRPGKTQQINSHNLTYGTSITRTTTLSWDATNCRPFQVVDEPGNSTLQVTTDIGYDSFGNVVSTSVTGVGMSARSSTMSYSDATYTTGQFPLSVTNAIGHQSTTSWNYDWGVPATATDPNGLTTSWNYDAFGRRFRENRPDGTFTIWYYGACPGCDARARSSIDRNDHTPGGVTFHRNVKYLDQFDREIENNDLRLDGNYNRTTRYFDALGRVSQEGFPYSSSGSNVGYTTYSYDLASRPISISRPVSDSISALQSTAIYYEGLATRVVDAEQKQSRKITNAIGELARSEDHDGYYQQFDYDAFGAPKRVQDSAGNTLQSSTYNIRGMLEARTDMDMGSWGFTPNALGEVVAQTDAKGQTTTFHFDLLGRLDSRTEAEGTSTWTWGAAGDNTANNRYVGRLKSLSGPGYSESYVFDELARLKTTTINSDTTYQIDYTYNSIGAIDTLTYPTSTSSYRLKLQYDYQFGYLWRIRDFNAPGTNFWIGNTFNARSQLTQEILGNGLTTNRDFDRVTGWLESIQTGLGGGTGVQNLTYEWDAAGNLKNRKDINQSNLIEEFVYDNLHRLDSSKLNGVPNLLMDYDLLGNIASKSDVGSYSYHATKKHQVSSTSNGWSFDYDNNGNMVSGRGASISWTSFNYPASITNGANTATFSYTPDRQYWRQVSNYSSGGSATTIYVDGVLEKVTTSGGTDYRHMIRAGGSTIVVSRQSSGTNSVHYVTSDHLGSSSAITNSSGGILVNSSFDAFGKRRGANWTGSPSSGDWAAIASTTRRGYTKHTMLDNLELIHMNGRIYDQSVGRFLSADPFIFEPNETQNYNRYSYVYNNPLSANDPQGFNTCRLGSVCEPTDQLLDQIARTIAEACMANAACRQAAENAYSAGDLDSMAGRAADGLNIRDFTLPGGGFSRESVPNSGPDNSHDGSIGGTGDGLTEITVAAYRERSFSNYTSEGCGTASPGLCHHAPAPLTASAQGVIGGVSAFLEFLSAPCTVIIGGQEWRCIGGTAPLPGVGRAPQAARGIAATAKELNQIAHVFPRAEKGLAALVQASGSELSALRGVQAAANQALAEGRLSAGPNGILPGNGLGAVLNVNGVNVQLIGGRVMNGVVELGSFVGL